MAHTDTMTEAVAEVRDSAGEVAEPRPRSASPAVASSPPSPDPATTTAPEAAPWVARVGAGLAGELRAVLHAVVSLAATLVRGAGSGLRRAATLVATDDVAWWEPGWRSAGRRIAAARRRAPDVEETQTGRRRLRWGQVFVVGVVAFALWLVCDAPTLMHNAEASPLGARRTAAMVVLRPIAALSRDLGLSHIVGAADRLMGRTGGGVVQVVGPPVRHHGRMAQRDGRPRTAPSGARATDALPPLPTPSAAAPLRVLSVGDSLGIDFGGPFVNDLAATGVVTAVLDAHVDTGLSRPDYFDWPGQLRADLARYQPQAVVVFLGANDPQNFVEGGGAVAYGTPAWTAAYARRVGELMAEATSTGARVLWVGMPPMADPGLGAKMQVLDGIFQSQAAAHPGVTYVASWPVFSDAQGAYAQYLPDASGSQVAVREPDGTHISPAGAERLARAVIAAMDHSWGLALQP